MRLVEGVPLCGTSDEPSTSTNIAEKCEPIFMERVVINNDTNEWKWTVQKLDDAAKALLHCFENEQLQNDTIKNPALELSNASTQKHDSFSVPQIFSNVEQLNSPHDNVGNASLQDASCAASNSIPIDLTENDQCKIKEMQLRSDIKKLFLDAIETGQWEEVVGTLKIDQAIFLQIIDGGGQPSFQEIFPLLICGPCVTLIIFNLMDDLEKLHTVSYQPKDGSGGPKDWKDTYSVKKTISHALSSFASQNDKTPCIVLVGTHKDKVKDDVIENVTNDIYSWVHQSPSYYCIDVKRKKDLITCTYYCDEQDIKSLRKKIEDLISQQKFKDIAAPWLMFDFVLHKLAKQRNVRKLEKSECQELAIKCGVTDYETVLQYFHYYAGTLLYYHDITKLRQYVITDYQLIFDSISNIIIQYFDQDSQLGAHEGDKHSLNCNGMLNASALPKDVPQDYLKPDELLSLLHHRHIISEIEGKDMFFMPSVLCNTILSDNELSNSSSFLVLFNHDYCPVGIFCAATTKLIVEYKWELRGESQFRNKINFYCKCSNKSYKVIFSAFPEHYEVCLMEKEELPEVKYMIYGNITKALTAIYKDENKSMSYGFYCPKKCTYTNATYSKNQHPATCGSFSDASVEMKCYYGGSISPLTKEHQQWFKQV